MSMDAQFHGGPLDGQHRNVWEAGQQPFSFRHEYTKIKSVILHWTYRWEKDHYECVSYEPMIEKRKKPMFDDIHDYDDGTDDAEAEAGPEA